jgi:hypothetical protein
LVPFSRIFVSTDAHVQPVDKFAPAGNPTPLPAGYLLPLAGRIVADGRHAFEVSLGAWRGTEVVLDPDPRAAATYVNDAFGSDSEARRRAWRGRARPPAAPQNVRFFTLYDRAGFPHAFWQVIRPIPPGAELLGDYGDGYWREGIAQQGAVPLVGAEVHVGALMRRLLFGLQGRAAACPIDLGGDHGDAIEESDVAGRIADEDGRAGGGEPLGSISPEVGTHGSLILRFAF